MSILAATVTILAVWVAPPLTGVSSMEALIVLGIAAVLIFGPPLLIFRRKRQAKVEREEVVRIFNKIQTALNDPRQRAVIEAEMERQRALKATPLRDVRYSK